MIPLSQHNYWVAISSVFVILASVFALPKTSSPEANIAEVIKQTLVNKSAEDMERMMKKHLIQMKLINTDNVWINYHLENKIHHLLSGNLNGLHLSLFVDKMAEHASNNPYLHDALKELSGVDLSELVQLVEVDGGEVLPDVIAFAKVLDELTTAMKEDWRVLEACHEIWKKDFTFENIRKYGNFAWLVKAVSVQKPVEAFLKAMETRIIDPHFGQYELPVNILEAKAVDVKNGYFGNAKAAWILAKYSKGGSNNLPNRPGPSQFSEDGKTLDLHLPLNKEWADLYQTWNLCFVSSFSNFPYYMVKLLIPSVSNYQEAPEGYIYSRALALYTTLNWSFLGRMQNMEATMDWANHAVTKAWGDKNAESSRIYERRVQEIQTTSWWGRFKETIKWIFGAKLAIAKWFLS